MADEKIIRIGADASGFGSEIDRMSQNAKRAFSDIGLDNLFDAADKQFDKLDDKIRSITEALKNKQKEANESFNEERSKNSGNDYYQRSINKDQDDYNKRHENAIREWEKFVDKLKKTLGKNNDVEDSNGGDNTNKRIQEDLSKLLGRAGNDLGQSIGSILPGKMGQILGGRLGNVLGKGGELLGRNIGGGSITGGGGGGTVAGEAAAGEAAAGGSGAGAAAGAASIAAVAAVVVAVAAVIKQLYGMGIDDWRTESKVNATFNIDRDSFGKGGSDFNLDNKEYKEFILQSAKSRGLAENIEDISRKQLSFVRGYGLSEQEVRSFDKFNYQDVRQKDGTAVIVDILSRSEKQGILGVSHGDFSRLPEKIEQVSNIMAIQKMSGEKADSLSAVNFMSAGMRIGGRFGDDRAAEVYGRMNESIRNPSNPGMKAFIFEMLKRSNPGASFTDIQGMMENGASGDNLRAILPSISKMPQGEMRRMVLYQLTKNMQDAIRLDSAGSLDAMIKESNNKGVSSEEAQKRYDTAMGRTSTNIAALDELGKKVTNTITDVAEKYIARPINDLVRGLSQGNRNDMMRTGAFFVSPMLVPFIPKGYDGNAGAQENAITPKGQ